MRLGLRFRSPSRHPPASSGVNNPAETSPRSQARRPFEKIAQPALRRGRYLAVAVHRRKRIAPGATPTPPRPSRRCADRVSSLHPPRDELDVELVQENRTASAHRGVAFRRPKFVQAMHRHALGPQPPQQCHRMTDSRGWPARIQLSCQVADLGPPIRVIARPSRRSPRGTGSPRSTRSFIQLQDRILRQTARAAESSP